MNSFVLLTISLGNLEISEISAAALVTVSLLFLVSFAIVSLKNDSKGMMEWMFDNKASEKRWVDTVSPTKKTAIRQLSWFAVAET